MAEPVENTDYPDKEEQVPALKGVGPFTPHPDVEEEEAPDADQHRQKQKRTKLHVIINEVWGYGELDDYVYGELIKYADPDKAAKTGKGFELELLNGRKIRWEIVQEEGQPPHEEITGSRKGFNQEEASAMAALAALRGWGQVSVFGSIREKEMLWLGVQLQNLQLRESFENAIAAGQVPPDGEGNFPPCPQIAVTNFAPLGDSEIVHKFKEAEAAYLARRPKMPEKPEQKAETPPPETGADDLKSKFQAEAEPPESFPEPESKFVPEAPKTRDPSSSNKRRRGHGRQTKTPHRHKRGPRHH